MDRKVVIVGAGCFGISTACHLLRQGYMDVTVIDRSAVLPAPDAASTDINKIVRSTYPDIFYSRLAQDSIRAWKNEEEWGTTYHESGVVVLDALDGQKGTYADRGFENDVQIGARVRSLKDPSDMRAVFPDSVETKLASLAQFTGYLNNDGGWAEAAQGVSLMLSRVISLGGKIVHGRTVDGLVRDMEGGRTKGVRCTDGTVIEADLVVLAAGSWMASSFPELNLDTTCLATGQSLAMIQLTREEADIYRNCPVVVNFESGFYMFPPDKHDVVKLSIHSAGYTHNLEHPTAQRRISTPRTVISHAEDGLRIPKSVASQLRAHLRQIYPELADKPFSKTRMCWYTDSPDGDWIIGYYPSDPSLFLATAGSGHAYKFLPVIGRLVADIIQGTASKIAVDKFSLHRGYGHVDMSRSRKDHELQELDVAGLCSPQDLLPH